MDEPEVRREDGELESSSSEAEDQEQLEDDSFLTAHEEETSTPGRYKQPRRSTRKSERSVSSLPESEIDRIISEVNNQAKNGACLSSSDTSLFPDSTAPSVSANSTILPGSISNMSVPLVDSAVVANNAEHGQENTPTDNMDDNAIRHMLLESIIKRRKKDKEEGEVSDADDENGRSPNNDLQTERFEKKTDGSKELRKKAAKTRHRRHSESRGEKESYRRGGHSQASSRSARGRERYRERDRRRHSSRSAERSKYDRSPRMSRSRKSSSSTPQPSTLKNLLEGLKPPWVPPPPPSSSPAYSDRSEDNRIIVSEDSSENIIVKEVREDYRHNDRSSGDHSRKRRKHSRSKTSRQAYTDMVLGISSANNTSNTMALDIDIDQNTSGNSGNISSISPPDAEERPASASANVPFCFTWKGNQQSQQQISPSILGAQILPLSPYGSLRRSTESQPPEVFQHSVFQRHQPQQPLTFMGRTVQPTICHGTVNARNGFRTASIAASGPSGGDNYDNVHMDMDSDSGTPDAGQRTPLNIASSSNRKRLSSDIDETKLRQMLLNQVETKRNSAPNSEDVGSESDILVTPPQSTSERSQQQNGRSSAAPNYSISINRAMKASPNVPVERTFPQKPGSRINAACILTPSPIFPRKRTRKRKAANNKNKQHSNMEDAGDEVITTRASYQQALKAINVVGVQLDKETAIVEKNVKKRKQLKAELEQCSSLLDRHHAAYTMLFKKRENLLKRVQEYERIKIEEIADSPTPSTSKRSRRVVDDDSEEEYEEEEIDVGVETDQEEEGESEYDMIEEDVEPEQDDGDNEEDRDDEDESNEDGSATPQVEEEMRLKLLEKQRSRQEKHRDIHSKQRSPAPECSRKDAGGVRVKEEPSSPVELEETFHIVLPQRSINREMCPYDINGRCKNSKCKWQHTSDMVKKDRQIIEAILQIEPNLMAPGQSVEALLAEKEREESFGEFVQRITNHLPVFRKRMIQLKINLLG